MKEDLQLALQMLEEELFGGGTDVDTADSFIEEMRAKYQLPAPKDS